MRLVYLFNIFIFCIHAPYPHIRFRNSTAAANGYHECFQKKNTSGRCRKRCLVQKEATCEGADVRTLLDFVPASLLRRSGNETLPALKRVRHGGSFDCWTLLKKGFSKYDVICNECLSVEATQSIRCGLLHHLHASGITFRHIIATSVFIATVRPFCFTLACFH